MPEYPFKKRKPFNPLPCIVLAGIILGIAMARSLVHVPATNAASPSPTYIGNRPTSIASSTADTPRIIKITPETTTSAVAQTRKPALDFQLKTLDVNEIKLSDLRGKTVLINLWATWCPPCRYEMPGIQAAYEKYKSKGLVVLGIDFTAQDNFQDVQDLVAELNLTFPILLDESGNVSAGLFDMRGLPTSYFIDTQGTLRRFQVGAMLPVKLEEYLLKILPKQESPSPFPGDL